MNDQEYREVAKLFGGTFVKRTWVHNGKRHWFKAIYMGQE